VSVGSAIAEAAYQLAWQAARELLGKGSYQTLTDNLDYGYLNGLLSIAHH
jgi:hypothetical protein